MSVRVPWTICFTINFRSHSLQILPFDSFSRPLLSSAIYFWPPAGRLNCRYFWRHFLQFEFPQKWQWLSWRSLAFFHLSLHVLHPSGVLWYSLASSGPYIKKMHSFSSNSYYRSPMKNFRLSSSRTSTLLSGCPMALSLKLAFSDGEEVWMMQLWLKA